jgi:hypothetical protein
MGFCVCRVAGASAVAGHFAVLAGVMFLFLMGLWMHEVALATYIVTTMSSAVLVFGVTIWILDHDDHRFLKHTRA